MTTIGKHFCIAPFTQLTVSPSGGYSPCAEIGGSPWKDSTVDIVKMWNSTEFKELRSSFLSNEKNKICNRCWHQEDNSNVSLRKRLLIDNTNKKFKKGELIPFLEFGHIDGPSQINIMVGNICNLRCRICNPGVSVTYGIEGKYYEEKYNVTKYVPKIKNSITLSDHNIDQIFNLGKNLKRIEFYGGEPLLDVPTLSLLEKLINSGQSKNITLFYNTNGTITPTEKQHQLWSQFKGIEFNFSIDDINERFTYNRHPANWDKLLTNIAAIRSYNWTIPTSFFAICTISNLNIFYLPELLNTVEELGLPYFLNNVNGPEYYDITFLPTAIKKHIIEKLKTYKDVERIQFLINMLLTPENLTHWDQFKFWVKAKDEYRKENFALIFPEFYNICKKVDPTF
jgi:radical SAM protein with 4Fe4S-binding SPASM domain